MKKSAGLSSSGLGAEQGVETTPQVFIGGERIGGSDDLERYLAA